MSFPCISWSWLKQEFLHRSFQENPISITGFWLQRSMSHMFNLFSTSGRLPSQTLGLFPTLWLPKVNFLIWVSFAIWTSKKIPKLPKNKCWFPFYLRVIPPIYLAPHISLYAAGRNKAIYLQHCSEIISAKYSTMWNVVYKEVHYTECLKIFVGTGHGGILRLECTKFPDFQKEIGCLA